MFTPAFLQPGRYLCNSAGIWRNGIIKFWSLHVGVNGSAVILLSAAHSAVEKMFEVKQCEEVASC